MINKKSMFLIIVMLIFLLGVMVYSAMQFATPFVSIDELDSIDGRIQVRGTILNGTIQYKPLESEVRFILTDGNHRVPVLFNGEKVNGLESGKTVVVIGKYDGIQINATKILIKCPSKYNEK